MLSRSSRPHALRPPLIRPALATKLAAAHRVNEVEARQQLVPVVRKVEALVDGRLHRQLKVVVAHVGEVGGERDVRRRRVLPERLARVLKPPAGEALLVVFELAHRVNDKRHAAFIGLLCLAGFASIDIDDGRPGGC
jgi:hypothetical protein